MLTSSNVPETDYAAYAAGTTYAAGNRVIVTASGVHKIYESLVGGNVGNYPPTDVLAASPNWVEVSATNRWKVFDSKVGAQTSQATSITYKLTPGIVFDSIGFLNINADSVQIVVTDPTDGIVYDKTVLLLTTAVTGLQAPIDWYSYFFSSFVTITDFVEFDLPPYLSGVIDITISKTGGTAYVGEIVLGTATNLGHSQMGAAVGIHDYSTKSADTWGVYSITERLYAKTVNALVFVEQYAADDVYNILAAYRAKPLVWVVHEDYSSLIVFGFYKDFNNVFSHESVTTLSLQIEGLT
jgi:hypothetical protein